jgi:hypothetical protein
MIGTIGQPLQSSAQWITPSSLIFSASSYKTFSSLKRDLENQKELLLKGELKQVDINESFYKFSDSEKEQITILIKDLKETKIILDVFQEWEKKSIQNQIMNKSEYIKKENFVNSQMDASLKSTLKNILDNIIKSGIKLAEPLEVINNSENYDQIINSLYEIKINNLFNTDTDFKQSIIKEIIDNRPFMNKDILEEFVNGKVSVYEEEIKKFSKINIPSQLLVSLNKIDFKLLKSLLVKDQITLSEKIIKEKPDLRSYTSIKNYIEKFEFDLSADFKSTIKFSLEEKELSRIQ